MSGGLFDGLRPAPVNLHAEQALLGAILANNRAFEKVAEFLLPEHFADEGHGRIYQRCAERILDGRVADGVSLQAEFGGYVVELITAMVGIVNAADYGRIIKDCWVRRSLMDLGNLVVDRATDMQGPDGLDIIEDTERRLSGLDGNSGPRNRLVTVGQAISAAIARADSASRAGVSPALLTGINAIDSGLGGFWPETFVLLGGVPGSGKTALAMQAAYNIADAAYRDAVTAGIEAQAARSLPGVAFFSLEMSGDELGLRMVSWRAGVAADKLRSGQISHEIAEELVRVNREAALIPLRIHDCQRMTARLLPAKIRMHLRRQPELLFVVDHLLQAEMDTQRDNSGGLNAAMVGRLVRDLRGIAREFHIPALVLTHVSRGIGERTNPRPRMSDVKWSGEGDADVVAFVHRPELFLDQTPPRRGDKEGEEKHSERVNRHFAELNAVAGLAELVIDKNRMGATGIRRMRFHGETTSFTDWVST